MSEVTDAPALAETRDEPRKLQGSHIWYELMTSDPDSATVFYGGVVPGWSIGQPIGGEQDYRIIGRSDGGSAGGVLALTDDMRQHGARPIWMGYIGVDDVDGAASQIEAKGGKLLMPAFDIPQGRIAMAADPQGNPFYIMKPIPPEGQQDAQSDVFSPDQEERVSWKELTTADPVAARGFYRDLFGWSSDVFMPMAAIAITRHARETAPPQSTTVAGIQPMLFTATKSAKTTANQGSTGAACAASEPRTCNASPIARQAGSSIATRRSFTIVAVSPVSVETL